ncbi:CLUMA_CG014682, isoform A [Clunio marinus]|uniref:CLUMA_CG014682, isoform A n=1 Tax=Clunio marinus TaxID=568069 RepID=A0A1J1IMZ3_9DIPT|nr:CLUMA_CG014682, isoform A [Clunio marinus]
MKSSIRQSGKVPYYKLDKEYESHTIPTFQSRRTLANHVRDNMLCAGRRSYFQRVIYLAKHKSIIEPHKIKDPFNRIIKEIYKYPTDDHLGGLLIGHDLYSMHMLEGSDELIGNYFQLLSKTADELFEKSRVVLVYNNINQRFLEKIVWRLANLPEIPDFDDKASVDRNISSFLKKMYYLCKKIKEEETDEDTTFKSFYLTSDLEEWIPDGRLMDAILDIENLQTIQEFSTIYGDCSTMLTFEEVLWPVSHDHLPSSIFNIGKYDVNLTFGKSKNESQ